MLCRAGPELPPVLFHPLPAVSRGLALAFRAHLQRMPLRGPRARVAWHRVRVNVGCAIHPRAIPVSIIDEHRVLAPDKPAGAPSPRGKGRTNRDTEAEADGASNKEPRTGRGKYDQRIVIRNHDKSGIRR